MPSVYLLSTLSYSVFDPDLVTEPETVAYLSHPQIRELAMALGAALINLWGPTGTNTYAILGIFSPLLGRTQPLGPGTPYNYLVSGWTQCTEIIPRSEIASIRKRRLGHGQ